MPKVVDHQARRQLLTQAVFKIVGKRGLDEVSVREVAAVAGVSLGTVQHYFRTKDELLSYAYKAVADEFEARVQRTVEVGGSLPQVLRAVLHELLPLDEDRILGARVWLAFTARAAVTPRLEEIQAEEQGYLLSGLTEALRAGQQRGEVRDEVDAEHAALLLTALIDGFTLHLLAGQPAATVLSLLDAQLSRLFVSKNDLTT